MPARWLTLAVGFACLNACVLSPLSANQASDKLAQPGLDGLVSLRLQAPAGAKKAVFRLRGAQPGFDEPFDDSPDDDFTVQFNTASLSSGMYLVDVFIDDGEETFASLVFLKPGAAPNVGEANAP